jgi:plastocyanin
MNTKDIVAPLFVVGIAVFLSMAPAFPFQALSNASTTDGGTMMSEGHLAEGQISTSTMPAPGQVNDTSPTNRTFYINTVEPEGTANIAEEPFPNSTLPAGGGYELNPPDEQGNWGVETYVFDPSQIVVYEGDQVTLNILGVNGRVHDISVNGYVEPFELHRGELKTVTFTADRAGTIDFICSIHQPTMHGQIMVLPRG